MDWNRTRKFLSYYGAGVFEACLLTGLTIFVVCHLTPAQWFRDTLTVGGDTPAHNYVASHLRQELFRHGRIISWAGGWWCGFPMFQFYFCLPYVLIAFLSILLPFNVAFKLVSVLGILSLPTVAWLTGRLLRLPRPVPALLAVASIPFLFVRTHTMWGANIASTLAGMVSNSLSFPLLLLAAGCAWRDAADARFRLRTVALFVALLASHFFTSVMAALCVVWLPLLQGRRRLLPALRVLVLEGLLALLLMAWWLVPLVAKADFSMEFGTNWQVHLLKTFPPYAPWLVPLVLLGVGLAVRRRVKGVSVFAAMLLVALLLFRFGTYVAPVFVNVRLWPFIFFGWLALAAVGLGLLLERRRVPELAVAAVTVAVLAQVERGERWPTDPDRRPAGPAATWARWNYEGLEAKSTWPVFRELVMPLRGTAGRLANDLHADNNLFGSTRIFEAVPHLIGKPILEGGLVNSAVGSMFAYYVQGEMSASSAGFPTIMQPASFNPGHATRHCELLNVKHFIARWPRTQLALRRSRSWQLLRSVGGWELFELTSHDGSYVSLWEAVPLVVETRRWKHCALEWLYTFQALDQPVVLVPPGTRQTPDPEAPRLTEAQFLNWLAARRSGQPDSFFIPTRRPPLFGHRVFREVVRDDYIAFDTDALGRPHLIKCSYYPNWKVRGAEGVFLVAPGLMLVVPRQHHVELYYGALWCDVLGWALTVAGVLLVAILWVRRPGPRRVLHRVFSRVTLLKFLDATVGFGLCWLTGYLRHGLVHGAAPPPPPIPREPQRILVIRPGGMGDMLMLLPALNELRRALPHAEVVLVCEQRNLGVLRLAGLADQALPYDRRPLRLLRRLLSGGFDVALDTEQFHYSSALLALLARAPVRVGFKVNPGRNLLYTHLVTYELDGYEGDQFRRLLTPLGLAVATAGSGLEGCLRAAALALPAVLEETGTGWVAIHPGSTTPYKQWPPERYGALIRELSERWALRFVLIGGWGDREAAAAVLQKAGLPTERVRNMVGPLELAETAALLARARLFVGGDSGLAHLAVAVGTPTVVLFGPSDEHKWGVASERHRVVRKALACAPCSIFGYYKLCRTKACMDGITVAEVAAECTRLLGAS